MDNNKNINTGHVDKQVDNNAAEAFILSRDPHKAMQEMMETIDALRSVYREENDILARSDARGFMRLQDRKIEMVRKYQSGVQQIVERQDEFRKADPALRARLVEAHEDFNILAGQNMKGLQRLERGVKLLGERIISAARDSATKDAVNYGIRGKLNAYKGPLTIGVSESA